MDIESLKKKYKDNTAQAKVVELEEQMKKGFESGDRNVGDIGADLAYYSELSLKTSEEGNKYFSSGNFLNSGARSAKVFSPKEIFLFL